MPLKVLEVPLEVQACTEWCWAAVALAIARFYQDPTAPQEQCQLVTGVLGLGRDCCESCDCSLGSSDPCNQPQNLGFVLGQHGRDGDDGLPGMSFESIKHEIEGCRPIALSISWEEAAVGNHALIICGYSD